MFYRCIQLCFIIALLLPTTIYAQDTCDVTALAGDFSLRLARATTVEELTQINQELTTALAACTPTPNTAVVTTGSLPPNTLSATNATQITQLTSFGNGQLRSFSVNSAGTVLASYGRFGTDGSSRVKLWDIATGSQLEDINYTTSHYYYVHFLPDSNQYVVAMDDVLRLREVGVLADLRTTPFPNFFYGQSDLSPDGQKAALVLFDNNIWIWNVAQNVLDRVIENERVADFVTFSPDGRYLAGLVNGVPRLWNTGDWSELPPLEAAPSGFTPYSLEFTPDGQSLIIGSDSRLIIWDIPTGRQKIIFEDLNGRADDLAVSPDGTLLAAACLDGTIRLYDLTTLTHLHVLYGHTDAVTTIQFSPDGTLLFSGGNDTFGENGTDDDIRVWGLP